MLDRRALVPSLLLLALAGPARADVPAGRAAIQAGPIEEAIAHLASDELAGRGSGDEGGRAAAGWLAEQLAALGVAPAGDGGSYFQEFEVGGVRMRNVVATIPGQVGGEAVVVGAHYDHLGRGHQAGSMELFGRGRGRIHNGADDNASGTVAVLEVARGLVAAGVRPRRRVVLCWFDGEERGLLGSEHLAASWERGPYGADRPVFMLNLDMVGRLGRRLTVYGAGTGDRLEEWVTRANGPVGLELGLRAALAMNSDHGPFYRRKVPVVHLFTGLHPDYHRPSDDPGKVNVEGTAQVARLALELTVVAAEDDGPLAYRAVPDGTLDVVLEQVEASLGLDVLRERLGLEDAPGLPDLADRLRERFGRARRPRAREPQPQPEPRPAPDAPGDARPRWF